MPTKFCSWSAPRGVQTEKGDDQMIANNYSCYTFSSFMALAALHIIRYGIGLNLGLKTTIISNIFQQQAIHEESDYQPWNFNE